VFQIDESFDFEASFLVGNLSRSSSQSEEAHQLGSELGRQSHDQHSRQPWRQAGSRQRDRESTTYYMHAQQIHASSPVPLGVDLAEVDAVLDDAAAAGEEEHVAVGEPELEGERAERQEEQEVEAPRPQRQAPRLPPRVRHLRHQRPVQQVLRVHARPDKQKRDQDQ
jgi:hypothetical protein